MGILREDEVAVKSLGHAVRTEMERVGRFAVGARAASGPESGRQVVRRSERGHVKARP